MPNNVSQASAGRADFNDGKYFSRKGKTKMRKKLCSFAQISINGGENAQPPTAEMDSLTGTEKIPRTESGCFVAEGPKVVGDLLPYFDCVFLGRTADCTLDVTTFSVGETAMLTGAELERASFLKTPREVIAVFRQPAMDATDLAALPGRELCLALDTVQDPGNLGTIVRLADWFGIRHIFCSPSTSDVFAPKVRTGHDGRLGPRTAALRVAARPDAAAGR